MKKIITGVKPTGASMHLGNLLGAVLPFQKLAKGNDAAIFIADLHALTSVKNRAKMRDQSHELAVEYFSIFGLDSDITIFRQSDIHDITKLAWILSNVTPYSLMLRAHSYKDFQQKKDWLYSQIKIIEWELQQLKSQYEFTLQKKDTYNELLIQSRNEIVNKNNERKELNKDLEDLIGTFENNLNMGVFNYPILMTADIIGYDIDAVPVGKDQIQHLEMTRDIARAFNRTYGQEVFHEPEAIISEEVATLQGIDGRKMSKSYDNFIGVFDDERTMKKRVMSIVTDSLGMDDVKSPDTCNVFALIKVFGTPDEIRAIRQKYLTPNIGFGYGHAKTALLEILQRYLSPYRTAREKLLQSHEIVEAKLTEWAKVMNARLDAKMKVVKELVGVN